uniref:IPT/TIG domain-containing protein n=1 Tax=Schistosoma curassoni TaxID=6186 RepID=A0A183L427_9TREM
LYSIFFYTDTLYWDSLTTCEGGFTCQILTKPSELLTKHGFIYRGCATPIVSSFSPFNIYAGSKITVSSPVLANCVDQLMINVGGADCTQPVQDINDSESIECDLSEEQVISAGLLTGQPLKPCSIYGGGQLIVYGSGFDPIYKNFNKITFNNEKECSIIEVTSGYIKCLVPIPDNTTIESNLNVTIQVQIKSRNQNDWIDTQHTTHSDCLYSYDITATPIIKNIEPREIINTNQTLTIYGSNLLLSNENYTNLQITLDNTPCIINIKSISINKLSCQLMNSLSSGYVTLNLFHEIRGYSKYETNLTIKSQITFYTIYPLEGSFAGGTIIKLNGNGLNDPTIKILFNLKECQIINEKNRTVNEIYCRTPEQLNYIQLNNYKVSINLSNGLFITNEYTYVDMKTPKVINITMNSINNNNGTLITQLNINGSMLNGDNNTQMKMTEVKLNQTLCTIVTIQNDYIQCYIVNLPSGIYQLIVDTPVYGYALSENNININFSLNSISPNSG